MQLLWHPIILDRRSWYAPMGWPMSVSVILRPRKTFVFQAIIMARKMRYPSFPPALSNTLSLTRSLFLHSAIPISKSIPNWVNWQRSTGLQSTSYPFEEMTARWKTLAPWLILPQAKSTLWILYVSNLIFQFSCRLSLTNQFLLKTELGSEVKSFLNKAVVATGVSVNFHLHNNLYLSGVDDLIGEKKANKSAREIGNVYVSTPFP